MPAWKRSVARAVGALMGAALVAGVAPASALGAASPVKVPGSAPRAKQSADQSASARAAATGEPVEVVEERTEYATTTANPDGTFTLTQSTRPQRARAKDGSWRGIDVTLERRADGTVGPKSAVVALAFSGGGSGKPMISLGGKRGSMSLGWPGPLPQPQLSGATATYPEVFKGVDLKLTATPEGYREVLVVKSADAAASPQLEQIRLSVKGDGLDIAPGAGGGLRAIDADGNAIFAGPAGVMWDSAGDAGMAPQLMRTAVTPGETKPQESKPQEPKPQEPKPQDPNRPGAGDASAELPVQVDDTAVAVKPDLGLLRGGKTVYPVFIDPPMGLALQERTVLSSDGDRFWDFDGEYGVGRCYRVGPWYCDADHTNRMYFEFAPTNLAGKHVVDAVFRAHETWSFSCAPHEVDLWRTNNISEGTRWPGPAQVDKMGDRNVSAGRGKNCTPEQPDSWIEFQDSPSEGDENLTSTVRDFANGKFSRLTLMLRAQDEGDPDAWKRFDDNAALQINYVPKPGIPTPVGVIPGTGTLSECARDYRTPEVVTVLTPTVVAGAQTLVQPQSNGFKGSLRVVFQAHRSDGSTWINTWGPESMPEAPAFSPDGTLLSKKMPQRQDGTLYRVRAVTQSFWTHEGVTSHMDSAPTDWCYFKVDTTVPKAPVITGGSPYKECVTAEPCAEQGGPGVTATFSFAPNAADSDVTSYVWRWQGTAEPNKVASSKAGSVPAAPPNHGIQILEVQASDVRNRLGEKAYFKINVAEAEGAVGRWRFDDPPGAATVRTSADTAKVGTRHDATLYDTSGAQWAKQGRRGGTDHSLGLNGVGPAQQVGYGATSEPVVHTRDSFTVSAWAYLTDTSANQVVLAAPGAQDAAFTLYYSSGMKRWAFNRGSQDKSGTLDAVALGDMVNPPARVWTHLAGVFDTHGNADRTDDTIQLFVNGVPQSAAPVRLTQVAPEYEPWESTQGLQFGRTRSAGAFQQYFHGYVDEVAVWRRPLDESTLRKEAQLLEEGRPGTSMVARWDAAMATGSEVADTSGYGRSPMKLAPGAVLSGNALVLDGKRGSASANGPVIDETGSFTVSARVRLNPAELATKPDGYRAQVAGQRAGATSGESSWALWLVKRGTDAYQWRFTRTVVGADGKAVQMAEATPRAELADVSSEDWADITGVFDAHEAWQWADVNDQDKIASGMGKVHLFVNSGEMEVSTKPGLSLFQQGSGELTLGRGSGGASAGQFLPGSLQELRVWTGAMTADQVRDHVTASGQPS